MSYNGTWTGSGSPVYGSGASGFNQDLVLSQIGYVALPVGAFPTTNNFSVSARIKTTSNGANPGVIFGVGNGTNANQFWMGVQNGIIKVTAASVGGAILGTTNVIDGNWHTILVVCNAGLLTLYVDGTQDGDTPGTDYVGALPTNIAIGNLPLLGTFEFNGNIDEIGIFTGPISPTVQSAPWANNTPLINALYHLDNTINDSAVVPASITSSPSAMSVSATNVSLTITGVSTDFTGSPFELAGSSGTGSPPTGSSIVSQTINSVTSATVVVDAPTVSSVFSIVDTGTGAFAVLTANNPLGTPGTPTATIGATGTGLTLTSSGSSGGVSPVTYVWYRGTTNNPTTSLTNQTALSITDRGLTPSTNYYYKVVATDAASNTASSAVAGPFETHAALAQTLKIGFIGDSLGAIYETGTEQSPQIGADYLEQLYGVNARTVIVNNQSLPGTTSTNWNPGVSGAGYFATALTSFVSTGVQWVHIRLGTNDSKNTVATTQSLYKTNISAMISSLNAVGIKVILSVSPYVNYLVSGSPWDVNSNPLLLEYQLSLYQLVDDIITFMGDDFSWVFFSTHVSELSGSDIAGVHPNETGLMDLGNFTGQGMYRAVYGTPASGSGGYKQITLGGGTNG